MKRLLVVIVVLGILGGGGYFGYVQYQKSQNPAPVQVHVKAFIDDIEDVVTATGTVEPHDTVDVGAQVSGQVMEILVEIGDKVEEGELLATIDATVYEAKVDGTRAQLKYQKAQMEDKKAQAALAKIVYERQKRLHAQNVTSLEAYENAELSYTSAKAQVKMLEAQIEQNESTLRAEEANLQYTRIYAPVSGTVVSVSAKKGQTLNANQSTPTILTIADLATMTVRAEVSEADIMHLQKGMRVYFRTLGSQKRWNGTLEIVEPTPTITNNVVLYNALFTVDNTAGELMTSMTAQVFFVKASARSAVLVPLSALHTLPNNAQVAQPKEAPLRQPRGEGREGQRPPRERPVQAPTKEALVKVVVKEGVLEERVVHVGVANRIHAQILSGVQEGELLVTSNVAKTTTTTRPQGGNQPGPQRMP
ncbi:MAG: efflux RND transporter periplasmic adaptor subunit [Campylobacterales bacterium]|nr:efflux RND transporter periplasmic adaptor subunit [Campylobacterales bacterium]